MTRTKFLGQNRSRDDALRTVEEGGDMSKIAGYGQPHQPQSILLCTENHRISFAARAVFQAMPAQRGCPISIMPPFLDLPLAIRSEMYSRFRKTVLIYGHPFHQSSPGPVQDHSANPLTCSKLVARSVENSEAYSPLRSRAHGKSTSS